MKKEIKDPVFVDSVSLNLLNLECQKFDLRNLNISAHEPVAMD